MNIIYTSENKIYSFENSNKTEIPCGRVIKYKETLDSIRRRSEWKTTGAGAMFTGTAMKAETIEMPARITGLACCGDKDGELIYGIQLDGSSSLYRRSTDRTDMNEGLILSGNDISFGAFDFLDGKLAVSIGSSMHLHIGVMEPPSSAYEEFTDGDTIEEDPYWSRFNKGRIYFSTAGYGRDANGVIGGISPRSGAYLDTVTREMEEFLTDPKYDYYKIKDDKYGNIYYIRQPYGGEKSRDGIKFTDVLFFPVRLLKPLSHFVITIIILIIPRSIVVVIVPTVVSVIALTVIAIPSLTITIVVRTFVAVRTISSISIVIAGIVWSFRIRTVRGVSLFSSISSVLYFFISLGRTFAVRHSDARTLSSFFAFHRNCL